MADATRARSSTHGGGFQDFEQRLDHELAAAEDGLRKGVANVVAYINDEIVPKVRFDTAKALRNTSEQLQGLADFLDRPGSHRAPGSRP